MKDGIGLRIKNFNVLGGLAKKGAGGGGGSRGGGGGGGGGVGTFEGEKVDILMHTMLAPAAS